MGCTTAAKGPTRGSAIALTSDDARVVAVNRDAGSVTVMSVDYADGQPKLTTVAEIAVGGEPWQVVIDGCDSTAYVVLRKDQKVLEITDLKGTPTKGKTVSVGSEPTSLALTPKNTKLFVSNWVDGTLSVIDPISMTVTSTVDLNATLAATGLLGTVSARPSLAHPRGVAVTNVGPTDDDETVLVTEWFAQRTAPEDPNGTNSDHVWKGLLYKVDAGTGAASTIDLPPLDDTGFIDAKGQATGCFPNQIASVTIDNGFAYVTSTCASPVGPVGVFQKNGCTTNAQCANVNVASVCSNGACTLSCTTDADCGPLALAGDCNVAAGGTCKPTVDNAKTTTHPALSIVDIAGGTATTAVLDKKFETKAKSNAFALRVPLLPTDVDFRPGFGYVAGEGADALFRLVVNNGAISDVGSASNNFIDLRKDATDKLIRLPIGVAVSKNKGFAFVANDGSRDVTAIDLNTQTIAGNPANNDYRIQSSTALPAAGSPEESALKGKRFFNTGLGRWSLRGQGWGSCGACHIDGLTDNVTWYFARGPRQTTSLDGSFASGDPTDQRIFNWSGINDEVADFEGNVRGISGGVGALVSANSSPPAVADRINVGAETPPQQGLSGSSAEIATPNGTSSHPHSVIADWIDVTNWIKTIRSPRRPTNLAQADVTAGKAIFSDPLQGNCIGCHSGAKWTISKVFYTPGDAQNTALQTVTWNKSLNNFPSALFPSAVAANQMMRVGNGAFDQLGCAMRPVGTIKPPAAGSTVPVGVSDAQINVLELRQDMKTGGQGSGALTGEPTAGFNTPSLLGMQVGAPFFHAGNARTLEELFTAQFLGHHQSPVAQVFAPTPAQVKQLVAYLLSIDEDEPTFAIPAKGASGGDICAAN
jgi:YVTN family beta-propeller protein